MLFLTLEIWPYLAAAAVVGLLTGWFAGCTPRKAGLSQPAPTTEEVS